MDHAAVREVVTEALSKLLQGGAHSRPDLFGDKSNVERSVQRNILERLVELKVLSKDDVGTSVVVTTKYVLRNREELEIILDDEERLSRLIWKNWEPPAKPAPPPEPPKPVAPPPRPLPSPPRVKAALPPPPPRSKFEPGGVLVMGPEGGFFTPEVWSQQFGDLADSPLNAYLPEPVTVHVPVGGGAVDMKETNALLEKLIVLFDANMESMVYIREKVDHLDTELAALNSLR